MYCITKQVLRLHDVDDVDDVDDDNDDDSSTYWQKSVVLLVTTVSI
jgi:hypothetical protein